MVSAHRDGSPKSQLLIASTVLREWEIVNKRLARWGIVVLTLATGWLVPNSADAQAQAALPTGWQKMSPTDFATAVRGLYEKGTIDSLSATDGQAVKALGKTLFL
ncbi:MAG: hypothetical protein P4L81_08055, partial [Candidatus Pacebacteria bacterium]|nr:hypothetical protein [Candidatus Paceibacterota bacterium]